MSTRKKNPATPALLDRAVDTVLAYRPKPKSDAGKARARKAKSYIIPYFLVVLMISTMYAAKMSQ